jgi:hypothetical protein
MQVEVNCKESYQIMIFKFQTILTSKSLLVGPESLRTLIAEKRRVAAYGVMVELDHRNDH